MVRDDDNYDAMSKWFPKWEYKLLRKKILLGALSTANSCFGVTSGFYSSAGTARQQGGSRPYLRDAFRAPNGSGELNLPLRPDCLPRRIEPSVLLPREVESNRKELLHVMRASSGRSLFQQECKKLICATSPAPLSYSCARV